VNYLSNKKIKSNQDIICNFCSEINGTGSQSEITVKSSLE